MTFLTPTPAILAAVLTIPALLIFYLLKLRRRPVRVSSTLLWRQATRDTQVNIPFRWLRPTLLFLLQLLILLLFLAAMARPALDMPSMAAARVILLLDRSASMAALDGDSAQRSLDVAKTRAIQLLDQYARGSGAAVSVIPFAAEARVATSFSASLADARSAIETTTSTDQPGDLESVLQLASTMLAADTDESLARTRPLVILFSDGGFSEARSLTLPGADFRFERTGPAPTANLDNLGIVALSARRDTDDPASVRVFVRVQSASREELAAPVSVSLGGREIDRRPLVTAPDPTAEPTALPSATATFQFASRDAAIVEVRIERPDLLAADNSAAFILAPATKPRLLLVVPDAPTPGPDSQPPRGPEWILTDLLSEMELPFRSMSASTFQREVTTERGVQADLIVFDRVQPQSLPPLPSLSFGAGLPLSGVEVPPETQQSGTYFISWQRTHPLLRDVSLDTVYIPHATPIPGPDTPDPGFTFTELARGATGTLIALAERRGVRHVVVSFPIADSTWPTQVSFPIFVSAAVDFLTLRAAARAGQMFTTGAPAEITLPRGRTRLELDGPTRLVAEVPATAAGSDEPQRVGLGLIERAGIYRAADAVAPGPTAIAVNLLDASESSLAVADALRIGGDAVHGSGGRQGPRELWPWCLIAALILLTIEWLLNAWSQRA